MGAATSTVQKVYDDLTKDPPTSLIAFFFFTTVTALLTFPILLELDRIHLTAPTTYSFLHDGAWFIQHPTKGREYIDHLGAMAAVTGSVERLINGGDQIIIFSNYAIPPSYIIAGMFTTIVFKLPTIMFHNLYFVASMLLAGFFTYLFVQEVLDDVEVSLLAGLLYMSSFYMFNSYVMGHTNQWQIQWIPLVLFGVELLRSKVETGFVGKAVLFLGIAFALQVFSSLQYSTYLSFILPLYLVLRTIYGTIEYRSLLFWKGFGAATVIAAVVSSPYLYVRFRLVQTGVTKMTSLQADMYSWYYVQNIIGEFFAADAQLQFFFRLLLVISGFVSLFSVSRQRFRQLAPFAFLFGICVMIAWGPFSPWAPYSLLHKYWPLIGYFRVPYRMLPFGLLGSSTLAASLLLHLPANNTGWSWKRLIIIGLVTIIQIVLVHHSLVFYEYMT